MRSHFLLHCSDNTIARTFTVKSLQVARLNIEARMMRVTDGEREVDKAGCELMLKLVKEESAQRQLLGNGGGGGSSGGGTKKQPGGSTAPFVLRPVKPGPDKRRKLREELGPLLIHHLPCGRPKTRAVLLLGGIELVGADQRPDHHAGEHAQQQLRGPRHRTVDPLAAYPS